MRDSRKIIVILGVTFLLANALGVTLLHLLLNVPWGKALAIDCAALPFVSLPFVAALLRGPLADRRPSRTQWGLFLAAPVAVGIVVFLGMLAGRPLLGGTVSGILPLGAMFFFFLGPKTT